MTETAGAWPDVRPPATPTRGDRSALRALTLGPPGRIVRTIGIEGIADMESLTLLGQALFTGGLAAWIVIGVAENIRYPAVNGDLVAMVMRMDRVREERPEIYAQVKGNAVADPRVHALAYRAIVAVELAAAILLTLGTLLLILAALGLAAPGASRLLGALGCLAFSSVWIGFLAGGQWFHYWAGWKDSQFTHFFLALWGQLTFVMLVAL